MRKNQCCIDKNGNCENNNNNINNIYKSENTKNEDKGKVKKEQIEQKTISRLQAIAMDEEDDFGEFICGFFYPFFTVIR